MDPPPLCVIVNPKAAQGRTRRRLARIRQFIGNHADFVVSREPGHAETLAYDAARREYRTIVAAGGDGTVHEVANGLLRAGKREVCFGVIPLGSGNDYAFSLNVPREDAVLCRSLLSESIRSVDVGEVHDDRGRERYFVNTLGLGLSGAVALEARKISGLSGLALYGLAAFHAIRKHFYAPRTMLTWDAQTCELRTLYLAIALGQREGGGFVVAPDAVLDDGLFDYLHAGHMSRLGALSYLPRLARGRLPENDPVLRRGRCRSVSLQSERPLVIHLDGELFATPEDHVRGITVRLLPMALQVRGVASGA